MKITLTFSMFCDEFNRFDDRKNTFTYNGKRALFDYLEELEQSTGEEIEIDVIALCCDYVEYDSVIEAANEYSEFTDEKEAREYLEERTTVIDVDGGGVIIQNF